MTIKERIEQWHKKDRELTSKYTAERAKLGAQLKRIQNDCQHTETRYHPDPSGNNDSWTECVDCGKEL